MNIDQSLQPGTRLSGGKFIIDRLIGRGGFSFIYEGRIIYRLDLDNDFVGLQAEEKSVVIKELYNKDYARRSDDRIRLQWNDDNRPLEERFSEKIKSKTRSEAIKLRNLRHPNILHIIGAVEENNTIYQITQKIEGAVDLSKKLGLGTEAAQRLSLAQARKYIIEVVQALKLVHSLNIIHLDIKPENILIDQNDRAILIDFGISMTLDGKDYQVSSIILNAASRPWAPVEQYSITDRSSVGFESDIYALGQTIYALLTGIIPPDHTSILSGTATLVAPSEYNREVSDYLDCVICKCIEMKRSHRYQTIEDFERAFNGEVEYNHIVARAEEAARAEQWAEAIALLNEAERYIPLSFELEELRRACMHSLTQQDIAQHLSEAQQLIDRQAYAEAKQELALLPQTEEVHRLVKQCDEALLAERITHLLSEAEAKLLAGDYPQAEALIEQLLSLSPEHRGGRSLLAELRADLLLIKALEKVRMGFFMDWSYSDVGFVKEEIIPLYEEAFELSPEERVERLSYKLANSREYIPKCNYYATKIDWRLLPLSKQAIEYTILDLKHRFSLYSELFAPLRHLPVVQDYLTYSDKEITLYEHLLIFFPNDETIAIGVSEAERLHRECIFPLQQAIAYLDQQGEMEEAAKDIAKDLRSQLHSQQEELRSLKKKELLRKLDSLVSSQDMEGLAQRLDSRESDCLSDEERQPYLKYIQSELHRHIIRELDELVEHKDFEGLKRRLNFSDADCLKPEERQKYIALLPKRTNALGAVLRWCLYGGLALVAGFALWMFVSTGSEPTPQSEPYSSPLPIDTIETDSLTRIRQSEVEELARQEAEARQAQERAEAEVAERQRIEAEAEAAKQKQEVEAKAQAERQRKEQVAKQEAESNLREALRLVQQADALFARRELEQACQLYVKANRLSKGSGNVGAERFERLAASLSDDTSAPAYKNAKERAARIRAAR